MANFFFGERGEGDEIGRAGLAPLLRGVVLVGLTPSCRIEHDQNQHDEGNRTDHRADKCIGIHRGRGGVKKRGSRWRPHRRQPVDDESK